MYKKKMIYPLVSSRDSCSHPLPAFQLNQTTCPFSAGSERHYTHSYSTFLGKLQAEPDFAAWLQPIEADLAALLTGPSWMGEPAARTHR